MAANFNDANAFLNNLLDFRRDELAMAIYMPCELNRPNLQVEGFRAISPSHLSSVCGDIVSPDGTTIFTVILKYFSDVWNPHTNFHQPGPTMRVALVVASGKLDWNLPGPQFELEVFKQLHQHQLSGAPFAITLPARFTGPADLLEYQDLLTFFRPGQAYYFNRTSKGMTLSD